ncbi:MAG: LapA family protein, partial [Deltaproteobacteria bacterium]|nr:LapA family protein [Deltaproteobacteria bacterium]
MTGVRFLIILTLFALGGIFIYQNTEVMRLTFLFWSVTMSTSLIVGAAFFAGFIAGLFLFFVRSRKK